MSDHQKTWTVEITQEARDWAEKTAKTTKEHPASLLAIWALSQPPMKP